MGDTSSGATSLPQPALELDEPGTFEYTAQRAWEGRRLNRFALSLRTPATRERFLADPRGYAGRYGLSEAEIGMVEAGDWTGLLRAGGHVQALLKVAVTMGQDLWDIGAANVGVRREALVAACPRFVTGVPEPVSRLP